MRSGKDRGQAMAEMVIIVPLLALIVLGALDLGRVFSVWLTLSNATREGARYVANVPAATQPTVEARTRADVDQQGIPADEVHVDVYPPNPSERAGGQPITVTARYTMSLLTTYIFGGQPVGISARTQMVVLPDEG